MFLIFKRLLSNTRLGYLWYWSFFSRNMEWGTYSARSCQLLHWRSWVMEKKRRFKLNHTSWTQFWRIYQHSLLWEIPQSSQTTDSVVSSRIFIVVGIAYKREAEKFSIFLLCSLEDIQHELSTLQNHEYFLDRQQIHWKNA